MRPRRTQTQTNTDFFLYPIFATIYELKAIGMFNLQSFNVSSEYLDKLEVKYVNVFFYNCINE
jgi:hypothetical protein